MPHIAHPVKNERELGDSIGGILSHKFLHLKYVSLSKLDKFRLE